MRSRFTLDHPLHRLRVASMAVALCLVPWVPARVAGFFLVAGVLPGCAVAARSRFRTMESLGLGTALSPVVFGMVALLAMFAGAPATAAAWIAAATGIALFVVAWRGGPDPGERRVLLAVAVLVALAAVMCFALPLSNSWWRARDDSWFHAAVTNKLLRDGLPLTDPYFAGLRLQYMYFYHAILGACVSLTGLDAFHAMILVNAIALVSCATAFCALAGRFATRTGPRVLATALWLFGMNGWFYLFYALRIARALAGDTRGAAVWQRMFPWSPNGHATAASLISVEGNQFMFLDKFMLGTAFSLTLGLAAALLFMLLSARRGSWSARHDAVLFLAAAGLMLLHPVSGITLAAVTMAVLALLLLVRSQTARGGPTYVRLVGWIAAGVAVTVPYIRSVAPRGGGEETLTGFAFQPLPALGLFAAILPALVPAVLYFRRAGDDTDTAERFGANPVRELTLSGSGLVALWFAFTLLVGLFTDLPANNETKFSFFAWLPLCALAAGCFERWWDSGRARRAAWLLVLAAALPLHMLYFHHAVRERSQLAFSDEERAVYRWIATRSPRDAVFIEEGDAVQVPVLGDRDLYWGTDAYARQFGYDAGEMAARRELRDRVFSEAGITDADVTRLRALGRPVFVIYRQKPDDLIDAPERFRNTPQLHGKFATTSVAVWEVRME